MLGLQAKSLGHGATLTKWATSFTNTMFCIVLPQPAGLIARCQGGVLRIVGREITDRVKVLKRQGCILDKMCKELLIEGKIGKGKDGVDKSTPPIADLPSSSPLLLNLKNKGENIRKKKYCNILSCFHFPSYSFTTKQNLFRELSGKAILCLFCCQKQQLQLSAY